MGDLGFAVRSVGISLGPGLVDFVDGPSLSADPPDLAAKQLMNEQGRVEDISTGQISQIEIHDANGKCGKPFLICHEPTVDLSRRGEAAVK